MNRLIIIGNGFDLAHGLKTSVKDFGIDYFNNIFKDVTKLQDYEDELVQFNVSEEVKLNYPPNYEEFVLYIDFKKTKSIIDKSSFIEKKFKYSLMQLLYTSLDSYQWYNIEDRYFKILIQDINPTYKDKIKITNDLFEVLKNKFLTYLRKENERISNEIINSEYLPLFSKKMLSANKGLNSNAVNNRNSIVFLDFNYTNTTSLYVEELKKDFATKLIHIHGDLSGRFGKPVFGYGDEFNKTYRSFEELNYNDLYRHIKSFAYSLNSNYQNLDSFINSNRFEIQIYGHSCGITDRTLLNQIFEHDNCESIKVFYYQKPDGTNDFVEKSYEIARHFKDKIKFRKRLIPLDKSMPMPQNK